MDNGVCLLGGNGFIGEHLIKNFNNSYSVSLRSGNWEDEILKKAPSTIINLVGKAHDHSGTATKEDYYYANLTLAKKAFEIFLNSSASLFIHISSIAAIEEYHRPEILVEESIGNPLSYYGKSKQAAEYWLLKQKLPKDKQLVILRPPMVHGANDKGNLGLLFKFVEKGLPYPLGAFKNKRSFISIQNFVFIIENIIERRTNLTSIIYNISDDEPIATDEIIFLIGRLLRKKTKALNLPKKLVSFFAACGDFFHLPINSKKLKKLTGTLIVSNAKLKKDLNIERLKLNAIDGLEITIQSFLKK